MKGKVALISLFFFAFAVFALVLPVVSHAAPEEGVTTQGEFALWLIKECGVLSKLPPAATGQDAINFLVALGVAPDEGWKEDEPITKAFLISLLGGGDDVANLSFDELIAKIRAHIQNLISDRNLSVFRATSSASASTPSA